jgi:Pvc16 N-terminal domain/Carboxypeptidase regulatory-like domain
VIHLLDNLIRRLLVTHITGLADDQVRFQPPDQDWRTYVAGLIDKPAVNVYLVELRENRRLRSNDATRRVVDGVTIERPAPPRVDCHYLITAWSPAQQTPAIEATLDEHELLAEAARVLFDAPPLVPRQVFDPDPNAGGFPEEVRDAELPATVLPVDAFAKYAEFWGTMGQVHPWKPAVYLVVTIPLLRSERPAGPMVTTRVTTYRRTGALDAGDVWVEIGGTVFDPAGDRLPGAWVQVEPKAPGRTARSVRTDARGRFQFGGLRPGTHTFRFRAPGQAEQNKELAVPSPDGGYDLRFP